MTGLCKIVSSEEMARVEALAYHAGASPREFMERAGQGIAEAMKKWIQKRGLPQTITILAGKGNNGGDAYVAGRYLMGYGFSVTALRPYPLEQSSPLCREMHDQFVSCQGKVVDCISGRTPLLNGVILDGLFGTGFRGSVTGAPAELIHAANASGLPICSIDIPSGLQGNRTEAIRATTTFYLECPKLEFFSQVGWEHVGDIQEIRFGLKPESHALLKAEAHLMTREAIAPLMPPVARTRHKYQAGYVLAVAGSWKMPGAAILASHAALRIGAGVVRLFHPIGMEPLLSAAPPELIRDGWQGTSYKNILTEAGRASAILIGPGIGRTPSAEKLVKKLLSQIELPWVIDADALYFVGKHPSWKLPPRTVLTPHKQEMEHLLASHKKRRGQTEVTWNACQEYVEEKKVTLVLKGAPTVIFHPNKKPMVIPFGDPGMATAGSGDVLTGMIAGMLAQKQDVYPATLAAVALHGLCGEIGAHNLTSYCLTASDLMTYLPTVIRGILCPK